MKPLLFLKKTILLSLTVLTVFLVSTILGLLSWEDNRQLAQIEREVEVLLYRIGALHHENINDFKDLYESLSQISLEQENHGQLESFIISDPHFNQSMTLLVDDGRRFEGKRLKSTMAEQVNVNIFDDDTWRDELSVDIEAYNQEQGTLVAVISRRLTDHESGKQAILMKELNLNSLTTDLRKLLGHSASRMYLVDSNLKFVELLGSKDKLVDLAGVKSLVNQSQLLGTQRAQNINNQQFDVVTRNISELNMKLVILYSHQALWAKNAVSLVWLLFALSLVAVVFVAVYRYFAQVEQTVHQANSIQDVYTLINQQNNQGMWEKDEVHIGKQSLQTINQLLPILSIDEAVRWLIESALLKTNIAGLAPIHGNQLSTASGMTVHDINAINRELGRLIEIYVASKCPKVPMGINVQDLNYVMSFELIQLFMLIADLVSKSDNEGRIEVTVSPDRDVLMMEFYGDIQWHVSEVYKMLINDSEFYYLFEAVGLLKMGSKFTFNLKNAPISADDHTDQGVSMMLLPKQVCFVNDVVEGGLVLQLMVKSLGVECILLDELTDAVVSENIVKQPAMIYLMSSKAYKSLSNSDPLSSVVLYGDAEDGLFENVIRLDRPYQLSKLEYVLKRINKRG